MQVPPAATVCPEHVSVPRRYGAGLWPSSTAVPKVVSAAAVTVTVRAAESVPRPWLPKRS